MRWQNYRRSSNVQDRRRVGKKTVGGGLTFIIIAIVVGLLGGDPSYFLSEGISRSVQSMSAPSQKVSQAQQDELVAFVSTVLAQTEDTWQQRFADMGGRYQNPKLVLFTGYVTSSCGQASASVGPFYCPLDQKVYIDLNFFHDLKNQLNAPGDFAQAYVVAHEIGHHVEKLLGVLDQADQAKRRSSRVEKNQISVKVELMADCLAGIWAHDIKGQNIIEEGDIEEALNAASQIGDDRLQKKGQGYVVPDSFTHGSSAQRYAWFKRGYDYGNVERCNTF